MTTIFQLFTHLKNVFSISFLLLSFLVLVTTGCDKNDDGGDMMHSYQNGIIVVNEGNFNKGNSSITHISPDRKTITKNIFNNSNSRPLGDIAQSIKFIEDRAFILVNNSAKIEVVHSNTFESITTVNDLIAPRYMLQVGENKAYITNIGSDKINVFDLQSMDAGQTFTLPCSGSFCWTERMIMANGKVFISNMGDKSLAVVNPADDQLITQISLSTDPYGMVLDQDDNLWILCAEGSPNLFYISTENNNIVKSYTIDNTLPYSDNYLCIDINKQSLYYLAGDVYALDINTPDAGPVLKFSTEEGTLYSLFIQPVNGDMYISNAMDFQLNGSIYLAEKNAGDFILTDTLEAGIIPGKVYFRN